MALTAQAKDDIFRNPTTGQRHFGRYLITVRVGGGMVAAVQEGVRCETRILLLVVRDGRREFIELPMGLSYRPALAVSPGGQLAAVWNEPTDDGWEIRTARIDLDALSAGPVTTIHASAELLQRPAAVFLKEQLYVAFSARIDGRFAVCVAAEGAGGWDVSESISPGDVDCCRPVLAARGPALLAAWDEYHAPDYRIRLSEYDGKAWREVDCLARPGQRWLDPRLIADDATAWLTCIIVEDVIDDELGVIDRATYAPVVRWDGEARTPLEDPAKPEAPYVVADLREGQLAGAIYKGHVGLRRNPQLSLGPDGAVWCLWESREENPDSAVTARLVGRRWTGEGWTQPEVFAEDGYSWSVADRLGPDGSAAVSCFRFTQADRDILGLADVPLTGPALTIDASKWNRWRPVELTPPHRPSQTMDIDGTSYRLVWADTHVHSVQSPDAEGEVDELVHFARDVAGLDAITIIDNDYYPHKALTEAEWRRHQAMAAHFTEPGRFVFLPGYEFTYHRTDLDPDFNHRCVIYPRTGPLLRRIDPQSNTDAKMLAALAETDGMAYPHHCSYALLEPAVEWNIEACSSWRVCLEETDFTIDQLRARAKIGFVGSSDTHRLVPGFGGARTGLWVSELSPEGLFDAYRNRRILASQGRNVLVDFRANGAPMGSSIQATGPVEFVAQVQAPVDIESIELLRDGEVIARTEPGGAVGRLEYSDEELSAGEHFAFVRVKLVGDEAFNVEGPVEGNPLKPFSQTSRYPHNLARAEGPFAWASPIWITR
jgi:hypothetical protein